MSSVLCEEKKSVKKLQIGIKKRVENCTIKSRKGDLLSMHYTVISFIFVATISPCISWKVRTKSGPLVGLICSLWLWKVLCILTSKRMLVHVFAWSKMMKMLKDN